MRIAAWALRHPVLLGAALAGLALGGIWQAFHIPLELYPEPSIRELTLTLRLRGGVAPEEVERQATRPVEEALTRVDGIRSCLTRSRSSEASFFLTLDPVSDPIRVSQEVQEALKRLRKTLPRDMDAPLLQWRRPEDPPLMVLAVGGSVPSKKIESFLKAGALEALSRLDGVAQAELWGAGEERIEVSIEPRELVARNLSVEPLVWELQNARGVFSEPPGGGTDLRVLPRWRSIGELSRYRSQAIGPGAQLESLGAVSVKAVPRVQALRLDGALCLAVGIFKKPGASSMAVSRSVRRALRGGGPFAFPGLRWEILRDQGEGMRRALRSLALSVLLGIGLSGAVLLLFRQSRRMLCGIVAVIPWVCLASFLVFGILRQKLNALALAGVGFGVGMAVDSSILMSEEVTRLRQKGYSRARAILQAAKGLEKPTWASTLTTIVVFLPLLLLDSSRRAFWEGFAVSVSVSLLISVLVAFVFIPAWLWGEGGTAKGTGQRAKSTGQRAKSTGQRAQSEEPWIVRFSGGHLKRAVTAALRRPRECLAGLLGLGLAGLGFVAVLGHQPFVWQDSEFLSFAVEFPTGMSSDVSLPVTRSIERALKELPDVGTVLTQSEPWRTRIFIRVASRGRRDRALASIRRALQRFPQGFSYDEGGSGSSGVEVSLVFLGDSISDLQSAAGRAAEALAGIRSLEAWKMHFRPDAPEVVVSPIRESLAGKDLTTEALGYQVHASLRGLRAGRIFDSSGSKEVTVRSGSRAPQSAEDLAGLPVFFEGGFVPLESAARIRWERAPAEIWRCCGTRFVEISARAKPFRWSQSLRCIEERLKTLVLPGGVRWEFGESVRDFSRSVAELRWALGLAAAGVLAALVLILRNWVQSVIILAGVPLGWIGGCWALWLAQKPLPEGAWVGFLLGSGVAVNHGVVWLGDLKRRGSGAGGQGLGKRFREVRELLGRFRDHLPSLLMNLLTSVLAALPVALGRGEGAWLWAPLTLAYVGSLLGSFFLAAVALPILWVGALDDDGFIGHNFFRPKR